MFGILSRKTIGDTAPTSKNLVEKGKKSGEFRRNVSSRAVAAALVGLLEGLMIRQYADPELTHLESDYSELVCLILDGISLKDK